jgi:hypothetical protein
MMNAQDSHGLAFQMAGVLLSAGPLLAKHPDLFGRAACVYSAAVLGPTFQDRLQATAFYANAIKLHHPQRPRDWLPVDALGTFQFSKPTPHLRDQQAQIEAMLAPLSDHRMRAHHASRHIQPTVARNENRVE